MGNGQIFELIYIWVVDADLGIHFYRYFLPSLPLDIPICLFSIFPSLPQISLKITKTVSAVRPAPAGISLEPTAFLSYCNHAWPFRRSETLDISNPGSASLAVRNSVLMQSLQIPGWKTPTFRERWASGLLDGSPTRRLDCTKTAIIFPR